MPRRAPAARRLADLADLAAPSSPEEASVTHGARKALFSRALAQGHLTREDIDAALPPGALTDSERWLLHYSLRAAGIDVRDRAPKAARKRGPQRSDRPAGASKPPRRT